MIYQFNQKYVISENKLSEIIFDNPYLILMLEHFGIELEVQEKTIAQICQEKEIDQSLFLSFSNLYNGFPISINISPSLENISSIISFLQKSHDYYTGEKLPKIHYYIQQLYSRNDKKEIVLLDNFFNEYIKEIMEHLTYETEVVFPYITKLYSLDNNTVNLPGYSMAEYKIHHNDIEFKLTDLKNLLIKYLPLKNSRQIRRKLLFSLYELEFDLNIHTEIEDHILIPLVKSLEIQRKIN